MITKIFKNDLVIPEFEDFTGMISVIYSKCQRNDKGKVWKLDKNFGRVSLTKGSKLKEYK